MPKHHTKEGFENIHHETRLPNPWMLLQWRLRAMRQKRNDKFEKIEISKVDLDSITNPGDKPQITWIGHSTVLIQYKKLNILTDPIFSDRASPVSFAGIKRFTKPALTVERLPRIDAVLISHSHYDHLDRQSVLDIGNDVLWIIPLKLGKWFRKLGITNLVELDWWQTHRLKNAVVTCTPAQHWSRRTFTDMNKTLWCSWAVDIDGFKFWFGGDTGYNESDFKEIGRKLGPFDAAAIPIGAYLPEYIMKTNHLSPSDAVQVHRDIRSKWSLAIHWATFILSDENVQDPMIDLEKARRMYNIDKSYFETLSIGETKIL